MAQDFPPPMRDPYRIRRILNKIETAWSVAPDLRLNQFLAAIAYDVPDLFYLEDDVFESKLDGWLESHGLTSGWKS